MFQMGLRVHRRAVARLRRPCYPAAGPIGAASGRIFHSHGIIEMAEDEGVQDAAEPQGNDEHQGNGADTAPQVGVISQYVKDLSFENPNAPAVYQWQGQPQIDVGFNIGAFKLGDDIHEVTLKVDVTARSEDRTAFQVELVYAGLFALRNIPEEQLQPFLLAEAPRILFPFARRIVADAVQDGGFPPLMLEPIDFGALYMQRVNQAETDGGGELPAPEAAGQA